MCVCVCVCVHIQLHLCYLLHMHTAANSYSRSSKLHTSFLILGYGLVYADSNASHKFSVLEGPCTHLHFDKEMYLDFYFVSRMHQWCSQATQLVSQELGYMQLTLESAHSLVCHVRIHRTLLHFSNSQYSMKIMGNFTSGKIKC